MRLARVAFTYKKINAIEIKNLPKSFRTMYAVDHMDMTVPDSEEIHRILRIVRMEDNANIKFKNCSLGMNQKIGIAMTLLIPDSVQ